MFSVDRICNRWNVLNVDVIQIYKCLCDEQRLRILNLLVEGPLCVCHLMEVLEADQVKMSKQLRYMKQLSVLESERVAQWMVYRLAEPVSPLLEANLESLRACAGESLHFSADLDKRREVVIQAREENRVCAEALDR